MSWLKEWAVPQRMEPTRKREMDTVKMSRRPKRSASFPYMGTVVVAARR
jgi:hypothetical protein